jgi:CheY-like chemotaxis protein
MAKILVVDDQEIIRELAVTMLEGLHDVFQAGSGEEALDILKDQAVDLVVSDVQMTGMSGLDLHDRIPERKFLFMTGYAFIEEWPRLGDTPLIKKPFKRLEFLEKVETILGG